MTLATSTVRALGALSAGLLTLGMLSACTPVPEPDPKPTKTALFTSDEEAFKAAEETYRAYNDAGNARRNGAESPDPQDFLADSALAADIRGRQDLEAAGLKTIGTAKVSNFVPIVGSIELHGERLAAVVCLDASGITTINAANEDVTPIDRPTVLAQKVEMRWIDTGYVITAELDEDDAQCAS
ncbi:MAG: hypothetical protein BGN97_05925 [Microbacterium sp. 69-10]|uniref:hypothetical protein n=1 Tax=Microbacterium sp. 69-10 TaxID=1895783 RepID=UPI00096027CB|nr:hypothetical protein [Microbacterium sp. 69-10]OJU39611.1 MAG: hypothetical protein BGN97_05925 [Microbacterium sp. 69-10]